MSLPYPPSSLSQPPTLTSGLCWQGPAGSIQFAEAGLRSCLLALDLPVYALHTPQGLGFTNHGRLIPAENAGASCLPLAGFTFPLTPDRFGDPAFRQTYGLAFPVYAGAMANAISSVDMIVALGRAGMMGSFGAAAMAPSRVEDALQRIQQALPDGPYAVNLIHSPFEPVMEHHAVDLFLRYGVRIIEASAFLDLTPSLVYYRLAGLGLTPSGKIEIRNRIIVKLSRREVAARFLQPAPADLVAQLLTEGKISELQARLADQIPMADDITVEADSGGHTDNRPLVGLVPAVLALRDEVQAQRGYQTPVRVGAAGGISTPASALAAFSLGAAYVVTGTVNQACVESGASLHTRRLLSQASMADVVMAPSADMFEMGVRVQVLKMGTMFPMRAAKLYEVYTRCGSIEEILPAEREKLEKTIFRRSLDEVWDETARFFASRDPTQLDRAEKDPRHRLALVFRWYLGLSSRWSAAGEPGREMDYQIWCGPSIGPFNDWTRGTPLSQPENRRVVDVNRQILIGAAYQSRAQALAAQCIPLPAPLLTYRPE